MVTEEPVRTWIPQVTRRDEGSGGCPRVVHNFSLRALPWLRERGIDLRAGPPEGVRVNLPTNGWKERVAAQAYLDASDVDDVLAAFLPLTTTAATVRENSGVGVVTRDCTWLDLHARFVHSKARNGKCDGKSTIMETAIELKRRYPGETAVCARVRSMRRLAERMTELLRWMLLSAPIHDVERSKGPRISTRVTTLLPRIASSHFELYVMELTLKEVRLHRMDALGADSPCSKDGTAEESLAALQWMCGLAFVVPARTVQVTPRRVQAPGAANCGAFVTLWALLIGAGMEPHRAAEFVTPADAQALYEDLAIFFTLVEDRFCKRTAAILTRVPLSSQASPCQEATNALERQSNSDSSTCSGSSDEDSDDAGGACHDFLPKRPRLKWV